jgi:hypothetical protein
MNNQIQIQFTGAYQLDSTTVVKSPLVTATAATDNFIDNVSVSCQFTGIGFDLNRETGDFFYAATWTNLDVENHINTWMEARKI